MTANLPVHPWGSGRACALAIVAAVSFAAAPAHGFGLKDVATRAIADLEAMANEDPRDRDKSLARRKLDWEVDKAKSELAEKAADRIEGAALRAGRKAWEKLEKTKTFGSAARKIARRYSAAVAKGIAVSPTARAAVGAWETGTLIGGELLAPLSVAGIDRYFEGRWAKEQERLARETAHLRRLGEQRRKHRENLTNVLAVGTAMRMLREKRERRAKAAADPWSDAAANPGTENDPWGPATSAWPPAARGATAASADAAADEDSNYEAALEGLTGSGARSAGYQGALEKLEADRRAERARRKAEAEAERQRETARAAAERREQAERDAAERRAAAARDSAGRQALERAARERQELSRRSYEDSVRQFNRAMRSLQETRRQQQRAYQLQKERDRQRQLQRQRQQQLEQARRQRMEEQRRERERQTYRPVEQEQRRQVQCVPKRKCIYGVCFVETCTTNTLGECVCI